MSEEKLIEELNNLKLEHKNLDDMLENDIHSQIEIQRIKKKKLRIKDIINAIESGIYPNIIA